jgi:hypothetical protein
VGEWRNESGAIHFAVERRKLAEWGVLLPASGGQVCGDEEVGIDEVKL